MAYRLAFVGAKNLQGDAVVPQPGWGGQHPPAGVVCKDSSHVLMEGAVHAAHRGASVFSSIALTMPTLTTWRRWRPSLAVRGADLNALQPETVLDEWEATTHPIMGQATVRKTRQVQWDLIDAALTTAYHQRIAPEEINLDSRSCAPTDSTGSTPHARAKG